MKRKRHKPSPHKIGVLDRVKISCPNRIHCGYKVAHTTGHGIYFIAAALESHGFYSRISLGLLVLMIIGVLIKEPVD